MEEAESSRTQKRRSLRNSVLKQPSDGGQASRPHEERGNIPFNNPDMDFFGGNDPGREFFGGIRDFFGGRDGGETFPRFGFGTFGNMDRFEEHLNDMMNRFFSDFQPESFADSQYFREDRDLDEDINRKGLDQALQTVPETHKPDRFFGGFSHSESTITRPDGSIEKRVTHRNSDGDTSTTVTIISPDGTAEVITDGFEQRAERLLPLPQKNDGGGLLNSIYDNFKRFF